ncbi:MAG: hypothetical protein ACD_28C00364G0006 [uncultured bacterium]|nr:MAG: hypothetical protein ACD_28C00364G0006 [uncultured bacterium]
MEKETKYVLKFSLLLFGVPLLAVIPYLLFQPSPPLALIYLGTFFAFTGGLYFGKFKRLYAAKKFSQLSLLEKKLSVIPLTLAVCGLLMAAY